MKCGKMTRNEATYRAVKNHFPPTGRGMIRQKHQAVQKMQTASIRKRMIMRFLTYQARIVLQRYVKPGKKA